MYSFLTNVYNRHTKACLYFPISDVCQTHTTVCGMYEYVLTCWLAVSFSKTTFFSPPTDSRSWVQQTGQFF